MPQRINVPNKVNLIKRSLSAYAVIKYVELYLFIKKVKIKDFMLIF